MFGGAYFRFDNPSVSFPNHFRVPRMRVSALSVVTKAGRLQAGGFWYNAPNEETGDGGGVVRGENFKSVALGI